MVRSVRFGWVALAVVALCAAVLGAVPVGAADPFVGRGSRVWDTSDQSSDVIGTAGPIFRFNVKTEVDLAYDADQFASEALAILSDQRSWIGAGNYRFQLVAGGSTSGLASDAGVEFTLYLATPGTADALCAPLGTGGKLSCRNGDRVVENFHRWMRGPDVFHDRFEGELETYRNYLINHEVGHRIGKSHQNITGCRADVYAPVMMQQTLDVRGCAINGWPAHDRLTVGREPAIEPAPSGPCDLSKVFPWTTSDRPLDDSVVRLYQAGFGRRPDAEGSSYWIDRRASGATLGDLAEQFLVSEEGRSRFGDSSNEQFVDLLYRNVLGRSADNAGAAFWLTRLAAGITRPAILVQFAESAENVERTGTSAPQSPEQGHVARLYRAIFDRPPDCEGARYWMWSPQSRRDVVEIFAGSPEFRSRYGSTTDAEFVDLLYRNVLARSPDPKGAAYWIGRLDAPEVERADVVLEWIDTPEFRTLSGTN